MYASYATAEKNSSLIYPVNSDAAEIIGQLEAEHLREIRRLDDIAYTLLRATEGDPVEAENILDDTIELLLEGGALAMWRYRIVLNKVREGL